MESASSLQPALYLVPVPIGNRDDITLRALRALETADIIACEDTRSTGKLLALYGITAKRLASYHEHNERERAAALAREIAAGKSVALVSDAGTPCVSDPGYRLVRAAIQAGARVVPLPGATAFAPALAASGLPTNAFTFLGFPPRKKGRQTFLQEALRLPHTVIFYESAHRVVKLLEEICALGAESRAMCLARELTKIHEEFLRGTAGECLRALAERQAQKGEFVALLEGSAATDATAE